MKQKTYIRSAKQVIRIQKRVLKLVDAYLAEMNQEELHGAGAGFMTIAEVRQHITALKQLRIRK